VAAADQEVQGLQALVVVALDINMLRLLLISHIRSTL
jgi:hypothetical protein